MSTASSPAPKVRSLSGFPEYLPSGRIVEQHILDVIREVFELHGFASIETRAVEPLTRLLGKGGDADKEIYGLHRIAQDSAQEAELGLHFDLTVPFARYVEENAGQLSFPFRRYQIQKVWRGERAQEGRYREFTQADIDVVDRDDLPGHVEAELPLVVAGVFDRLPLPGPMRIHVNNRMIPEGFYQGLGVSDVAGVLRVVDKLDKIGAQQVDLLLQQQRLSRGQAEAVLRLASISSSDTTFVERVRELGVSHSTLEEGLRRLEEVMTITNTAREHTLVADLRIARGLDYYTGTVYETVMGGYESWGSFCSGGRYDNLVADPRTAYPGVGISIGVSRLLGLLLGQHLLTADRSTPSAVLVAVNDEASRAASDEVATALRARGIACEVSPTAAKFGKQIRFAERRGIPYVWFANPEGAHAIKDIRSGVQTEAEATTWTCPSRDLRPTVTVAADKVPSSGR